MANSLKTDMEEITAILHKKMGGKRILVAIAGPPGVGKTTFSIALCEALNSMNLGACAILPVDGYHYDDIYLNERGWRSRKGAPHTYDIGGLDSMLKRLSENSEDGIAIPVFDREIEIARAGANEIDNSVSIVLVEGNYLLLKDPRWTVLSKYFELSIFLNSPTATIINRLHSRWVNFDFTDEEITSKLYENDIPNMEIVMKTSVNADYEICTDGALDKNLPSSALGTE